MLCSRVSFRLSVRQIDYRSVLRCSTDCLQRRPIRAHHAGVIALGEQIPRTDTFIVFRELLPFLRSVGMYLRLTILRVPFGTLRGFHPTPLVVVTVLPFGGCCGCCRRLILSAIIHSLIGFALYRLAGLREELHAFPACSRRVLPYKIVVM